MFRRLSKGGLYPGIHWPLGHYGWILMQQDAKAALPLLQEAHEIRHRTMRPGAYWRLFGAASLGVAYTMLEEFGKAEPLLLGTYEAARKSEGGNKEVETNGDRGVGPPLQGLGQGRQGEGVPSTARRPARVGTARATTCAGRGARPTYYYLV